MPKSEAVFGIGTKLHLYDNTGANPVAFSEVVSIDRNRSREFADATHMLSPDGYRENKPGLKNAGSVQIELHKIDGDTTHEQLLQDFENGTLRKFAIEYPAEAGGDIVGFEAHVENVGEPIRLDALLSYSVSFRVSGPFFAISNLATGV